MSGYLEHVMVCQKRLIDALDARNAAAIEAATTELADALSALGTEGAVYGVEPQRLDQARRQAEAARVRVNILSEWTRQRIDRLAEIRTGSVSTYSKKGAFAPAI